MLFSEFFPRLRARAMDRYGEELTERQFRDWREDGLLPGPAKPVGQGRGRAPHRHWPHASYRRALRICRYKSRGACRTSQWWIGFWLSGETVPVAALRAAFKREFRIARRPWRSVAESNRWLSSTFNSAADIERGASGSTGLLKLLRITPDQFRRLAIQLFEEPQAHEDIDIANESLAVLLRVDFPKPVIGPELRMFFRVGYMGEGRTRPGGYLDAVTDGDLDVARAIFRLQRRSAVLNYVLAWTRGDVVFEDVLVPLIDVICKFSDFSVSNRVGEILQILFNLTQLRRDGLSPEKWISELSDSQRLAIELVRDSIAERGRPDFSGVIRAWDAARAAEAGPLPMAPT